MHYDPQERHIELMRHAPRALTYKAGEDFAAWQVKAREKLAELLGLPLEMPASDNFNIEWEQDGENFHEIRFTYASEPEVDVCCNLWLPKGASGKIPVVICLQGHSTGAHISMGRPKYPGDEETISGGDRDFAKQIVARGQAALVMEQRAFGERGGTENGPDCYQPAMAALLLGRTLVGERCWDVMRGIDCLENHFADKIDLGKIALQGQSGGGTVTCYAAALDTRIAAAVPASAFCGYLESIGAQKHCTLFAKLRKDFHTCFVSYINSANREFAVAEKLYAAAGAPDKVRHVVGPEGHRFYAAQTWPVFDEVTGWRE